MQARPDPDEDISHFQKVQPASTKPFSRYRLSLCLSLTLVLVLLALCFLVLPGFSSGFNAGCVSAALNSTCQPQPRSTSTPSPTTTVSPISTPIRRPVITPTRVVHPSPAQTPTPPTTILPNQQVVTNMIHDYREYVISGSQSSLYKAYDLLSQEVQYQEPLSDFVKNPSYTLPKGCLIIGDVTVTQEDSQIWDASIPVTKVSCVDQTPEVYYSWHFQVYLGDGPPEIISIGLYPAGSGNQ